MTENKELSSEEKVNEIFEKIEFLELTSEQKEEAAKEIVENIAFDKLYFLEICLSTIIIVFWLFQDSAVVVIGYSSNKLIIFFNRKMSWKSSCRVTFGFSLLSFFSYNNFVFAYKIYLKLRNKRNNY